MAVGEQLKAFRVLPKSLSVDLNRFLLPPTRGGAPGDFRTRPKGGATSQ